MAHDGTDRQDAGGTAQGRSVALDSRFEILVDQELPVLSRSWARAVAAQDVNERTRSFFALVLTGGLPPRADHLDGLHESDHPGLTPVMAWGPIDWPHEGRRRMAIVFEQPPGKPLMSSLDTSRTPMTEDALMRTVIAPMVSILRDLETRNLFHGAIRPSNIFQGDATGHGVTLGECVSAPAGMGQPLIFETVERSMAEPIGRGDGSTSEDLYAMGVTLLFLLLGRNPVPDMTESDLLEAKLGRGTYATLVGKLRIPNGLVELLRGLLSDDPNQRWAIHDIELWLSGRRLSPKQALVPGRAQRPFRFMEQDYWTVRSVARAFSLEPRNAAPLIENGELLRWIKRSTSTARRAQVVEDAIQAASDGSRSSSFEERMVARVSMALDPSAPIRYKGRALLPQGLAGALADAFNRDEGTQEIAEIVAFQFPLFWCNVQPELGVQHIPLVRQFDTMRSHLDRTAPGWGLERCLYAINPMMPCLSPLVADANAVTAHDLIHALETAARAVDRETDPIDRHVAAFIAARSRGVDEWLLRNLAPGNRESSRLLIMLSLLSDLQRRYRIDALPHLCRWFASRMDPVIDEFHYRPLRDRLRGEMHQVVERGSLIELQMLVDDPKVIKADGQGYANARKQYAANAKAIRDMRYKSQNRVTLARDYGRQGAVAASTVIAGLGMVFVFLAAA